MTLACGRFSFPVHLWLAEGQKAQLTGKLFNNQVLKREIDRDFGRVVRICPSPQSTSKASVTPPNLCSRLSERIGVK